MSLARRCDGCSRIHPNGMASWICDQTNGSPAVWQVKRKPGNDGPTNFLRLVATRLDVRHLNVDDSVESADLAFRDAQRSNRCVTRNNLDGEIRPLHRC